MRPPYTFPDEVPLEQRGAPEDWLSLLNQREQHYSNAFKKCEGILSGGNGTDEQREETKTIQQELQQRIAKVRGEIQALSEKKPPQPSPPRKTEQPLGRDVQEAINRSRKRREKIESSLKQATTHEPYVDTPKGDLMTFQEVLEELQIDEEELKRLISNAELRSFRSGAKLTFKRGDVQALLGVPRKSEPEERSDIGLMEGNEISDTVEVGLQEELEIETVLSHFDFENIDPGRNCLLKQRERLIPVSLKEMAEKRRQAAVDIVSMLQKLPVEDVQEEHLKNLRKLRFSRELQPLYVLLDRCWYLDAEMKSEPQEIDFYTADVLVFKEALLRHIILPSTKVPNLLELRKGHSIVIYPPWTVAGSDHQWEIIPSELPSFRDIPMTF